MFKQVFSDASRINSIFMQKTFFCLSRFHLLCIVFGWWWSLAAVKKASCSYGISIWTNEANWEYWDWDQVAVHKRSFLLHKNCNNLFSRRKFHNFNHFNAKISRWGTLNCLYFFVCTRKLAKPHRVRGFIRNIEFCLKG